MKDSCLTTHASKYMIKQLATTLTPKSMMAYEGSESARDNFGKFIHQFQPETKTLIRKLKKIIIKLYRQNVSLLFNKTLYIYIYICVCVCVCVCVVCLSFIAY